MIQSYQEEQALIEKAPANALFATIGTVYSDGVTLIFDGWDTESSKHYKVNKTVPFVSGDRVKIIKDSGTYIVEYVVGSPVSDVMPIFFRYYGGRFQAKNGVDGTWVYIN